MLLSKFWTAERVSSVGLCGVSVVGVCVEEV
jgi:hypothetical protein